MRTCASGRVTARLRTARGTAGRSVREGRASRVRRASSRPIWSAPSTPRAGATGPWLPIAPARNSAQPPVASSTARRHVPG